MRGLVSLAFLARLEDLQRAEEAGGDPAFRLCDAFDLIGGASTGAIIAAGLALGFSVAGLAACYRDLAARVFRPRPPLLRLFRPKFDQAALSAELRRQIGDVTLGSDRLRTGLAILAKRLDTGSAWILSNNPCAPFSAGPPDSAPAYRPNRDLELWRVVRASTAAPSFFAPEALDVGLGAPAVFVDGAVSPFGNPAPLLLMMATLDHWGLRWPVGAANLTVVSVGTGRIRHAPGAGIGRAHWARHASTALLSVLDDTGRFNEAMMQWLSDCPAPWMLDREIGPATAIPGLPRLCRYVRYELPLDRDWLRRELQEDVSAADLADFAALDTLAAMPRLHGLASAAAARQVRWADLAGPAAG